MGNSLSMQQYNVVASSLQLPGWERKKKHWRIPGDPERTREIFFSSLKKHSDETPEAVLGITIVRDLFSSMCTVRIVHSNHAAAVNKKRMEAWVIPGYLVGTYGLTT